MEIIECKKEEVLIIEISGRLDVTNSKVLEENLIKKIDSGESKIVLDCGKLEYISSSGLRVFLVIVKKLGTGDGNLFLCNLRDNVKEVFDISGFVNLFKIYLSQEEAIKGF
jgi:anti-anti-sigma factor